MGKFHFGVLLTAITTDALQTPKSGLHLPRLDVAPTTLLLVLCFVTTAGAFVSYWLLHPWRQYLRDQAVSLSERISDVAELPVGGRPASSENLTNRIFSDSLRLVDVSIVIPAYNETARLPKHLTEIFVYFTSLGTETFEIIVVDDGSSDDTFRVALDVASACLKNHPSSLGSFVFVKLAYNQGKGAAVKAGVHCSSGKFVLMADADGATKISDFNNLQNAALGDEVQGAHSLPESTIRGRGQKSDSSDSNRSNIVCHVVFGSRQHLVDTQTVCQRAWHRNLLMHGFWVLSQAVLEPPRRCVVAYGLDTKRTIFDTQCGFKLFSRVAARAIFPSLHVNRWAFDIEIVMLADRLGFAIGEVAVNWTEIPGSKLSPLSASLQMARDMLLMKIFYSMRIWDPRWNLAPEESKRAMKDYDSSPLTLRSII